MVTLQGFTQAVMDYAQSEVLPHLPKEKQFMAGMALGIAAQRSVGALKKLQGTIVNQMLEIITDEGIDDDVLLGEMRTQMQKSGQLTLDIPLVGGITFGPRDVDALQRAMQRQKGVNLPHENRA